MEPGGISLSGFVHCAPLNTSLRTKEDSWAGSRHFGEHCLSSTALGPLIEFNAQKGRGLSLLFCSRTLFDSGPEGAVSRGRIWGDQEEVADDM